MGCVMIDLSDNPNFQTQLDDGGTPATIVHVQEDIIDAEKTFEADWGANSAESNVDYTSSPPTAGDVILTKDGTPFQVTEYETGGDTWYNVAGYLNNDSTAQGFKVIQDGLELDSIEVYLRNLTGSSDVINIVIWDDSGGQPGSAISGSPVQKSIPATSEGWYSFDLSGKNLALLANIQYYIRMHSQVLGANSVDAKFDNNDATYPDGSKWSQVSGTWSEDTGDDFLFRVSLTPFNTSGSLTTDNLDLGQVPTTPGEWQMQDTKPAGTDLTYEAWNSSTGVFDIWNEYFQTGSYPSARQGFASCIVGDDLYIFGGYDGSVQVNELWKCDLSSVDKVWTQLTSGATARDNTTLVADGGKLYVFGGWNGSTRLNDLHEYTISTDSWSLKSPSGTPPTARQGHIAVVDSGKIYIHGGLTSVHQKDIHIYDISGNSWASLTSGNTERYGHVAEVSGGKIYVYAGWNTGTGALNSVEEYSISGDSWANKTSGGTAANLRASVLYNGKIYVHGGNTGASRLSSTFEYDISGDSWTIVKSGATARSGHGGVLHDDKMYILGGYDGTGELADLWSYGTLGGDAVSVGTIVDGDPITDLQQYWRVRANFTSNTNRDETPTLHSIKADFSTYKTFTDSRRIARENNYEMGLMPISGISSEINDFKESTIGQITPMLDFNESVSKYLYGKYPKNKIVIVLIGFDDPAFPVSDFLEFFRGQVVDYNITRDDKVALITQAFQVEWNKKVPETWEDTGDDVTWTDMHPTDVMLDIIRNYMTVRDSKIVASSFAEVKALIPSYTVTLTITKNPVEASKLMEQLRLLTGCYFLPRSDGKIKIKRFDPTEAVVATLTDANTKDVGGYKGNLKTLINKTLVYYGHDGDGDDAADYTELAIDVTTGAISHDNWGEWKTKEIKDKWTLAGDSAQVISMSDAQLARYKNPPAIIQRVGDKKLLYIEAGDMVAVTVKRAPSVDGVSGIVDKKFQVIKPSLDFKGDKVTLTLLEA